jgi:hypothetical protein
MHFMSGPFRPENKQSLHVIFGVHQKVLERVRRSYNDLLMFRQIWFPLFLVVHISSDFI